MEVNGKSRKHIGWKLGGQGEEMGVQSGRMHTMGQKSHVGTQRGPKVDPPVSCVFYLLSCLV